MTMTPQSQNDLLTALFWMLLVVLFTFAAIPGLARKMANWWYAHSIALSHFWAWQVAAFRAYATTFRQAKSEAEEG